MRERERRKEQKFQIDYRLHPYWKTVYWRLKYSFGIFQREKQNYFWARRGRCNERSQAKQNEVHRAPHADFSLITNQVKRNKNWFKSLLLFSDSIWMRAKREICLVDFESTTNNGCIVVRFFCRCRWKKKQWIYCRVDAIVKYSLNTFRNIIIFLSVGFAVILFLLLLWWLWPTDEEKRFINNV